MSSFFYRGGCQGGSSQIRWWYVDVISNGVDVIPSHVDVISNDVDVISNDVDVIPNHADVISDGVDVIPNHVDVILDILILFGYPWGPAT